MEFAGHVDALERAGMRMAEVVESVDLDAAVPPCPGWAVRDLVQHLGGIHRWATRFVVEARMEPIEEDLEEIVGGWPPDVDLVPWFREGHRLLVESLASAPQDLECFTFLAAPSPLEMWARRQAHETSIHRLDAEAAAGTVTGFDVSLAVDGIDELLTAFISRPGRGPRRDVPSSLSVLPIDDPARWTVLFDRDGCQTVREVVEADASVAGAASDLYAWVWNRPTVGRVEESGDRAVLDTWRTTVHVRWS